MILIILKYLKFVRGKILSVIYIHASMQGHDFNKIKSEKVEVKTYITIYEHGK